MVEAGTMCTLTATYMAGPMGMASISIYLERVEVGSGGRRESG